MHKNNIILLCILAMLPLYNKGNYWYSAGITLGTTIGIYGLLQIIKNPLLHFAVYGSHKNIAQFALVLGADPNKKIAGDAVLQIAFENRGLRYMELLLKHKADPNFVDENANTLLHIGFQNTIRIFPCMTNKELKKVELLLKYGADPNLKNNERKTALHKEWDKSNVDAGFSRILLKYGAHIDMDGDPLLWRAFKKKGYKFMEELLLNYKADPNVTKQGNSRGDNITLLFAISEECHDNNEELLLLADVLLKRGADVYQTQGYRDETPLHAAIENNYIKISALMLWYAHDRKRLCAQKNKAGQTPLDLAISQQARELLANPYIQSMEILGIKEVPPAKCASEVNL